MCVCIHTSIHPSIHPSVCPYIHTCIHAYIHAYNQNLSIHNLLVLTLPHTACSTPILHHLFSVSCFPHAIFTFLLLLVGRKLTCGVIRSFNLCIVFLYLFSLFIHMYIYLYLHVLLSSIVSCFLQEGFAQVSVCFLCFVSCCVLPIWFCGYAVWLLRLWCCNSCNTAIPCSV